MATIEKNAIRVDGLSPDLQHLRPYFMLWLAVFLRGIQDCKDGIKSAIRWMQSDEVHPGSYIWLCDLFDIQPRLAREKFL